MPKLSQYCLFFEIYALLNTIKYNAIDVIIVLLLSLFDMILVCTSVVLLFIPFAKWYKKQNSKHSTVPYPIISWEFSENYKLTSLKKPLWMVTLSYQLIFLLSQWHSKAGK